jgi:zinc transport system ATP-binding protein
LESKSERGGGQIQNAGEIENSVQKSVFVEIRDVWFSYDDQPVLMGVNLDIRRGDFLAVLGPNGGGKTTLVKLILGLLKPDRGSIRIFGMDSPHAANKMGYVPQDTQINKGFPISVLDVVLMGRLGRKDKPWSYSRNDRNLAEKALEKVGILEYRDRLISRLSGGERQRVFIARALVSEPEILFLDEPTSSVDQEWHTHLYELLQELNRTVTIVVVSHDISILSSYVKSVACVNRSLYYHDAAEITKGMLEKIYHCPVELVAHGLPHRVLEVHRDG